MTAPVSASGLSWGISTLGCPELRFPQICKLLSEFGLRELEIRAVDGRIDLPQWARGHGLAAVPGNRFARKASHPIPRRRFFLQTRRQRWKVPGRDAGVLRVGRFLGRAVRPRFWRRHLGASVDRSGLRSSGPDGRVVATGKKVHGWRVELLLETHDGFSASGPCRDLLARLREPIGIIWDSHHTWRLGGESPRESWSQLSKWIRHVHVKDSIAKPSARHPFTYVLPGDGETPLGEIVEVLREHHFTGMVSLEWERLWHPYLPPLREALTRLQAQPWFLASAKSVNEIQSPAIAR